MENCRVKRSLAGQIAALGIGKGDALIVHKSEPIIHETEDGAAEWLRTLRAAVGREGSLMSPATDPIGRVLQARRGARRSDHPAFSFVAAGRNAEFLTRNAPFHFPLGSESPLARLHQLNGGVLLLGVDQSRNLALHLAEIWADMPYTRRLRMVPSEDEAWKEMAGDPGCSVGFPRIEPVLRQARILRESRIEDVPVRFMRVQQLVSMAGDMLRGNPEALLCDDPACESCKLARKMVREITR